MCSFYTVKDTCNHAVVICPIDFCNSLFYGLTANNTQKLQTIQSCQTGLQSKSYREHDTFLMKELHWLLLALCATISYGILYSPKLNAKQYYTFFFENLYWPKCYRQCYRDKTNNYTVENTR